MNTARTLEHLSRENVRFGGIDTHCGVNSFEILLYRLSGVCRVQIPIVLVERRLTGMVFRPC